MQISHTFFLLNKWFLRGLSYRLEGARGGNCLRLPRRLSLTSGSSNDRFSIAKRFPGISRTPVHALLRLNNARDECRSFFELSIVGVLDNCARKTSTFLPRNRQVHGKCF